MPRVWRTGRSWRDRPSALAEPVGDRRLAGEGHRRVRHRLAVAAEHLAVVDRLRRRDRGVGVAHRGGGDGAHLDHHVRLHAEEGRRPDHEVGELADRHRADPFVEAVGDRRVDGVLGDVALDPEIVVAGLVLRQAARAGPSSCARSARCGSAPRRRGPSPGCRRRSSRRRPCRGGCPRRRWSPCGCGSRRRRRPRGWWGRGGGRP